MTRMSSNTAQKLRDINFPTWGSVSDFYLEKIIDELPENIENGKFYLCITKRLVSYACKITDYVHDHFHIHRGENESVAEAAAKLLIKLHDKGIIKFENKDNG